MSLLGTFPRSQTFPAASRTIAAYSHMARDLQHSNRAPCSYSETSVAKAARRHVGHRVAASQAKSLEDVFVQSLVAAGRCWHHQPTYMNATEWHTRRQQCSKQNLSSFSTQRHFSMAARRKQTGIAVAPREDEPEITREEYKDMVNTYGSPSDFWEQPAFFGQRTKQAFPLAPRLVLPPEKEDQPPYKAREILAPEDEDHAKNIQRFDRLLGKPPGRVSHSNLWRAYHRLRSPRVRYLADKTIRDFFSHLSWTEFKHSHGAKERFLALLDECVGEQVPLTVTEWSSAINLAGRALNKGTSADVKHAIELWLRMEDMGIQANHVTFNILFYVAVKAGRFALADTIYNELQVRGLELDRYFRISMIYYAGLRGNGDNVRKAFNDLVNSGEIVDVAVMNCVILSLIRAGEAPAAEHVFLKMKALHETKFGTRGPDDWRAQRKLAKLLNTTGKRLRKERDSHEASFFGTTFSGDDKREQIQRASPIAPNARTYRLLLRHHARVTGDMDRLQELLAESKARGFHTHGSVYLNIFYGFTLHGGYSFTAWKSSVLESFWQDFLAASSAPNDGYWLSSTPEDPKGLDPGPFAEKVDKDALAGLEGLQDEADGGHDDDTVPEEEKVPYFTTSLAICIVRAFYKCLGRKKMLEVWDEIKARWKDCGSDEKETIEGVIEEILRQDM